MQCQKNRNHMPTVSLRAPQSLTRASSPSAPSIVIKKYANRRLYNTDTSTYVTLDDLASMVRSERDFVVYDARTGEDLTHAVLTQIIVEQESKGNQNLLPIGFLRQLIRFYGNSIERLVPSYLEYSLDTLTREQEKYRQQFANTFGSAALEAMQEQTRKNLAHFRARAEHVRAVHQPSSRCQARGRRRKKKQQRCPRPGRGNRRSSKSSWHDSVATEQACRSK